MNRESILKSISQLFPEAQAELIVVFGSQTPGHDIDILVLTRERQPYRNIIDARLDIVLLGVGEFETLLSVCDPLATEPVLTGSPILGSVESFKTTLVQANPDIIAATHAMSCSLLFLKWAYDNIAGKEFQDALRSCSFAVGHSLFARHYHEKHSVITLRSLVKLPENSAGRTMIEDLRRPCSGTDQANALF
jgi:hypothetical protein